MEMNKHEAQRILGDVHSDHKFKLKNGKKLSNLKELHDELGAMDAETFKHHVNEERHDFAQWVHHSVNDPYLSKVILRHQTEKAIKTAIKGRIFQLRKHLRKDWLKNRFAKWEMLDFALGILVGVGVAIIIVLF